MNTPELQKKIDAYADAYAKITGFRLNVRGIFCDRVTFWYQFIQAGFSIEDMEFVLRHLMAKVRKGDRNIGCLRFSNLIERPDRFEEELGLAHAEKRNAVKPMTPKESVIRAMPTVRQGSPVEPMTAKPVGAYIAALRQAVG